MRRKIISVLSLIIALALFPSFLNLLFPHIVNDTGMKVNALTYVGMCGKNCEWNLNIADGVLTVYGNGKMDNYEKSEDIPWFNYRDNIIHIVINDGITTVGNYSFSFCDYVKDVDIGKTVVSIGDYSFYSCSSLQRVMFDSLSTLKKVGSNAFAFDRNLYSFIFPETLKSIGYNAFEYCYSLNIVFLYKHVAKIRENAFCSCVNLNKFELINPSCKIYGGEETIFSGADIFSFKSSTAKEYADSFKHRFSVSSKFILLNDAKIKLNSDSFSYTGYEIKPLVYIKGLTLNKDYAVSYIDNKKPGIGTVIVSSLGKRVLGDKSVNFKILPLPPENFIIKKSSDKNITILWDKVAGANKYFIYQLKKNKWVNVSETEKTSVKYTLNAGKGDYIFKIKSAIDINDQIITSDFSQAIKYVNKKQGS